MAAIIENVQIGIAAVHPGPTTMVDALVADVHLRAEWAGRLPPTVGQVIDVELDIDAVLEWEVTIAIGGGETLRPGPVLRGTVERQERDVLTMRIAEGFLQVEIDNRSIDAPPGTAIAVVADHLRLYPTNA
ncbi:hypothetical protein [Actinoplanes flavus]|uniref:Uncharacterized protein n=1 Tax=Actinoplanes flavus TaxID=2820290 RepID=A0ABS3UK86_9ACTN|nr:hypothetical protein [Actinoplanes flavus]MBO3739189.1 hypothetical protein [Actinoplanes flavus]